MSNRNVDPMVPSLSPEDRSGTEAAHPQVVAAELSGEFGEARPRYEPLKRFAKVLSKRFAIRLSNAQEILCRASGFDGMKHLQQLRHADVGAGRQPGAGVSFHVWARRLRSELGADFDELMAAEEQFTWWRRLHGRREAVVEPQCP